MRSLSLSQDHLFIADAALLMPDTICTQTKCLNRLEMLTAMSELSPVLVRSLPYQPGCKTACVDTVLEPEGEGNAGSGPDEQDRYMQAMDVAKEKDRRATLQVASQLQTVCGR